MTNVTAEMARESSQKHEAELSRNDNTASSTELDGCYRQIGIPAVAAAVRYQGVAKNPAYAPAPTKWQELSGEAAA